MDRSPRPPASPLSESTRLLARRAVLAFALIALAADAADAQGGARRPDRWELGAGVSFPGTFLEDGNGTTVTSGVAPIVTAGTSWRTSPRVQVGVLVRVGAGRVRAEDEGRRWETGSFLRTDLFGVASWERGRFAIRGAAGPVLLKGPSETAPFRGDEGMAIHWGGDVSADAAVVREGRVRIRAGLDFLRLTPRGIEPPPDAGTVMRLHLGVVYAR